MQQRGQEIHGEIITADATGGVAGILYDPSGNVVALASNERVVVCDVHIESLIAMAATLYGGTGASAAAGETIAKAALSTTNGTFVSNLGVPFYTKRGVVPKLVASAAGSVTVTFTGFILRA